MDRISVLIPTYGRFHLLQQTLRALARQDWPHRQMELVVVSSDTPEMPSFFRAWRETHTFANVHWIYDPPAGPARARNRAVEAAQFEILLFLDDDVVLAPDAIRHHMRAHQRTPDPRVAFLGRVELAPAHRRTAFGRWMEEGGRHFLYPRFLPGQRLSPIRFYTAQVSLKRSFLGDLRFCERFDAPGYEDGDLGLRLAERGLDLRYLPQARGIHLRPADPAAYWQRVETVGHMRPILLAAHPHRRHPVENLPGITHLAAILAPPAQRVAGLLALLPARYARWTFPFFSLVYGLTLLRGVYRSPHRA